MPVILFKDPLFPRDVGAAIEDEQMLFGGVHRLHLVGSLRQSLALGALQRAMQQLQFDDDALHRSEKALFRIQRPLDQQIGAAALQSVFALDASAAIDNRLQEGL